MRKNRDGGDGGVCVVKVDYRDEDNGVPREYKIVHEPSPEDLEPTPYEKRVMRKLLKWRESSRKVWWEIGKPVEEFVY